MPYEEAQNSRRAPTDAEPSDGSLLRRFRDGSQDAATQIYQRYFHRLRALAKAKCAPDLASRIDAEDIVQSVFGSFFRAASQGYYSVPAGEELWKLFLVIALNKIRARGAFHRAAKRDVRVTGSQEALENWIETTGGAADDAQKFLQFTIDEALERLSPIHKRMVLLRIEGYEVVEISQQTGRSKRTVERILQETRKQLADLLPTEA